MKTKLLLSILVFLSFQYSVLSQSHVWNGSAGDEDWFNSVNWDSGTVPTSTSTVLIENGIVEIVNAAAQANTIDLTLNSVISIENNLTLSGDFHNSQDATILFKKGTISGGAIQNFGLLQIETLDAKNFNGTTLNNFYEIAIINSGVVHFENTVNITNHNESSITIDSNGGFIENSGVTTFTNEGYIQKLSGAPGFFYMIYDMNNSGIIDVGEDQTFLFLGATQNFINLENGVLRGTGAFDITATFSNTGIISPAGDISIGTLEIVNVFDFPQEAILKIDVAGASQYDAVHVFGSPLIEGTIELNMLSELQMNDELTIITSTNNLTCNLPATVQAHLNTSLYTFDVICNPNSVVLKVSDIGTLGTEDFNTEKTTFFVSPNPVIEEISFQYSSSLFQKNTDLTIELFNLFGQKIASLPVNSEITTLSASQLSSGCYFARLISEKGVLGITKILVE